MKKFLSIFDAYTDEHPSPRRFFARASLLLFFLSAAPILLFLVFPLLEGTMTPFKTIFGLSSLLYVLFFGLVLPLLRRVYKLYD